MSKRIGEVRKFAKNVEETREIEFVFSDETRDSYNTVLLAKNWDLDRFNKCGVAFYNHNSHSNDPDMMIGSARAWVENGKLLGVIKFEAGDVNQLAEKIFRKILAGTVRAVSVGFIPKTRGSWGKGDEDCGGKNETYYYGRCELLEISVVNVPANKNALVRSAGQDPLQNLEEEEKKPEAERIVYRMADFEEKNYEGNGNSDDSGNSDEGSEDDTEKTRDVDGLLALAAAAMV